MSQNARIEVAAGWHRNISNGDYHGSNGASSSYLKRFLEETPHKIEYERLFCERKSSPAFDLGTATHTLVLEPQKFQDSIIIRPSVDLRTKNGRAIMESFEAERGDRVAITAEQLELAQAMAHELLSNRVSAPLLEGAIVEQSIYWHQELEDGQFELCKVRPDALCRKKPLILDVKTCESASYDEMRRSITKYRYHLSAAMYLEGVNQCGDLLHYLDVDQFEGFVLLCVESKPPHQVACYEIGFDLLGIGRVEFMTALTRMHNAQLTGWSSYPDVLRVIDAPKWNPTPPIL